jgi:hypothetical protein
LWRALWRCHPGVSAVQSESSRSGCLLSPIT